MNSRHTKTPSAVVRGFDDIVVPAHLRSEAQLSSALFQIKQACGIGIRELAKRMKTSATQVYRLLNFEKSPNFTHASVAKLAEACGLVLWTEFVSEDEFEARMRCGADFTAKNCEGTANAVSAVNALTAELHHIEARLSSRIDARCDELQTQLSTTAESVAFVHAVVRTGAQGTAIVTKEQVPESQERWRAFSADKACLWMAAEKPDNPS